MQITSIAVIGAGPLGREISCLAARAGYQTVLEDVNPETIELALAAIREWLHAAPELKDEDRAGAVARISTSRSIEDAMRAARRTHLSETLGKSQRLLRGVDREHVVADLHV